MTLGCAPGKVILLGEHAVVYGRPAIAVPVQDVQACVTVQDGDSLPGITVCATELDRVYDVGCALPDEPLCATVRQTLDHLGIRLQDVSLTVTIRSSIPVASGLGSGAAVAAATARALGAHLGHPLDDAEVSAVAYETERIHHGTPSGIDNTVVSFGRPVHFRRGDPIETLEVRSPFWLVIADTGLPSLTKLSVADVRVGWEREPARYEGLFDRIAALVGKARRAIEQGSVTLLGTLMSENQDLLRELDVSSPEIERLVQVALRAGAGGAKLSGGGRGGNVIALIDPLAAESVRSALLAAGAKRVIVTKVG